LHKSTFADILIKEEEMVVEENKMGNKTEKKPRNAVQTQERILASAKAHFSKNSYENVGVREIAADANVDAALVNRYFGSKENLFREVATSVFCKDNKLPIDLDTLGESLAKYTMAELDENALEKDFPSLQLLLRSAVSPIASPIISQIFHKESVCHLASLIGGKDSELKAGLIISYLIGLATMRVALKSQVIISADTDKIVNILGTAIQACIKA
jgi:hypothetical protein